MFYLAGKNALLSSSADFANIVLTAQTGFVIKRGLTHNLQAAERLADAIYRSYILQSKKVDSYALYSDIHSRVLLLNCG